MKRCAKCGEHKSLSEFPRQGEKLRSRCKPCHTEDARKWALENHERYKERLKKWHRTNKPAAHMGPPLPQHIVAERRRASNKAWEERNKELALQLRKEWADKNRHYQMEIVRWRQARKQKATPPWADRRAIRAIYQKARELSDSGHPHDVDHIIPLKHDLVCGLHCEANLQVIPRKANRSKSNRWAPDQC